MLRKCDEKQEREMPLRKTTADYWVKGAWVRQKYVVDSSLGLIRPVGHEPPEAYDPFEGYSWEGQAKSGRTIYLELTDLDLASDRAIEYFTTRWGLLGLFQDRLLQSCLHVSRDPNRHLIDHPAGACQALLLQPPDEVSRDLMPVVVEAPGGHVHRLLPVVLTDLEAISAQMHTSPKSMVPEVICEIQDGVFIRTSLASYYRPFFPTLDTGDSLQVYQHARLSSPTFWGHLCEPLEMFKASVTEFKKVVRWSSSPDPAEKAFVALYIRSRLSKVRFDARVDNKGRFLRTLRFPSLLSALYVMLVEDLDKGVLRVCPRVTCKRPFVPNRTDRTHCSTRCRDADRQKRLRDNRTRNQGPLGGDPEVPS